MDGIKIDVIGNVARVVDRPAKITAGTVGLPVEFSFDSQWYGLSKTAVFQAGDVCKIVYHPEPSTIVPWELLVKPGAFLIIGVYGTNKDGTVVIPTTWATVGGIVDGANPDGDASIEPSLPVWQKICNTVGDLSDLSTNAKDNLVDAINELYGIVGAGGNETATIDDEPDPPAEEPIPLVEIDTTLTQEGKAADAKATGDAIRAITAESVGALSGKWNVKEAAANGTLADAMTISADAADGENNVPKLVTADITANILTNCKFGIRTVEWYSPDNILSRILGVNKSGMPTIWVSYHNAAKGTWTGWMQPDMVQEITGCYYRMVDDGGTVPAIEWITPPMYPNVEYRTAERWNGKPVYCKVFEIGSADIPASSGSKRVEIGIEHTKVVRYHCFASYSTNIIGLPYADSSGSSLTLRVLGTGLFLIASSNAFSGYTATFTVYYVK